MLVEKNYDLYQGDTFGPHSIKFKKIGFNFIGCTIKIEGKDSKGDYVFEETPAVDISTVGELSFNFIIAASKTILINYSVDYDIQLIYSGGELKTPVRGILIHQSEITR